MSDHTETQGEVIDRLAKEEADCFPADHPVTLTMLLNVVKRVARSAYNGAALQREGPEGTGKP